MLTCLQMMILDATGLKGEKNENRKNYKKIQIKVKKKE